MDQLFWVQCFELFIQIFLAIFTAMIMWLASGNIRISNRWVSVTCWIILIRLANFALIVPTNWGDIQITTNLGGVPANVWFGLVEMFAFGLTYVWFIGENTDYVQKVEKK